MKEPYVHSAGILAVAVFKKLLDQTKSETAAALGISEKSIDNFAQLGEKKKLQAAKNLSEVAKLKRLGDTDRSRRSIADTPDPAKIGHLRFSDIQRAFDSQCELWATTYAVNALDSWAETIGYGDPSAAVEIWRAATTGIHFRLNMGALTGWRSAKSVRLPDGHLQASALVTIDASFCLLAAVDADYTLMKARDWKPRPVFADLLLATIGYREPPRYRAPGYWLTEFMLRAQSRNGSRKPSLKSVCLRYEPEGRLLEGIKQIRTGHTHVRWKVVDSFEKAIRFFNNLPKLKPRQSDFLPVAIAASVWREIEALPAGKQSATTESRTAMVNRYLAWWNCWINMQKAQGPTRGASPWPPHMTP